MSRCQRKGHKMEVELRRGVRLSRSREKGSVRALVEERHACNRMFCRLPTTNWAQVANTRTGDMTLSVSQARRLSDGEILWNETYRTEPG